MSSRIGLMESAKRFLGVARNPPSALKEERNPTPYSKSGGGAQTEWVLEKCKLMMSMGT